MTSPSPLSRNTPAQRRSINSIRLPTFYSTPYPTLSQQTNKQTKLTSISSPKQILQRDPHGPLKHALCALASFHSTKLHMQGLGLVSEDQHTRPLHKHYFDQGHRILEQRRASWGGSSSSTNPAVGGSIGATSGGVGHPEDDALSAIFLIAYYSMVSTGQKWLELLEIAYAWFAGCGLVEEQNPKMKLWGMNEVQRVAVKAVMVSYLSPYLVFFAHLLVLARERVYTLM